MATIHDCKRTPSCAEVRGLAEREGFEIRVHVENTEVTDFTNRHIRQNR